MYYKQIIKISRKKTLSLEETIPEIDECKEIVARIIKQAARDFINFKDNTSTPIELEIFEDACDFLFDNDYRISWGNTEKSLNDLLDILDIDIDWFREKILEKTEKKVEQRNKKIAKNSQH